MVAVEQTTQYKKELLAGDIVHVRSQVLETREKVIRFMHIMRNTATDETVATCTITAVHIDRQTRKSCPLPEKLRAAAELLTGIENAA